MLKIAGYAGKDNFSGAKSKITWPFDVNVKSIEFRPKPKVNNFQKESLVNVCVILLIFLRTEDKLLLENTNLSIWISLPSVDSHSTPRTVSLNWALLQELVGWLITPLRIFLFPYRPSTCCKPTLHAKLLLTTFCTNLDQETVSKPYISFICARDCRCCWKDVMYGSHRVFSVTIFSSV